MKLEFQEYQARKILNLHKHVDGPWFWDKYSAHPYVGCRSGCEFCYSRGGPYLGRRDPDAFDTVIRVKTNAAELLRRELARRTPDVLYCADWQQPAEDRYRLSRAMLEAALDAGFPVLIIERSPLVTRDLDLLTEINKQTWVGAAFSLSSVDPALKRAFEPRSPDVRSRLQAMEQLALAGIRTGASLMPVLPFVGDDEKHLADAVRAVKDHGGSFVMAGGLTMAGAQAERTLAALRRLDPSMESRWRGFYHWREGAAPEYGPAREYTARLGKTVRELCGKYGLTDRMPRYAGSGPLAANRKIAERLFLKTYDLELEQAAPQRIWAYRKAAWTVDELPESIAVLYKTKGETGLTALPGVGKSIAAEIIRWLREETTVDG